MASHVAITQTTGTDKSVQEAAGTSYAHAVRFKPADNKENINDEMIQRSHSPTKGKQIEMTVQPLNDDNDGTFTPVINHNRRERKNERTKRDKGREIKVLVNGVAKDDKSKEHSNRERVHTEKVDMSNGETTDAMMEKKVFVEAPLPKINPWQVNKAVVQAVAIKDTSHVSGKRVLQPQKQDAAVNGQSTSVIRAKDKRKYNHKVCYF